MWQIVILRMLWIHGAIVNHDELQNLACQNTKSLARNQHFLPIALIHKIIQGNYARNYIIQPNISECILTRHLKDL